MFFESFRKSRNLRDICRRQIRTKRSAEVFKKGFWWGAGVNPLHDKYQFKNFCTVDESVAGIR